MRKWSVNSLESNAPEKLSNRNVPLGFGNVIQQVCQAQCSWVLQR